MARDDPTDYDVIGSGAVAFCALRHWRGSRDHHAALTCAHVRADHSPTAWRSTSACPLGPPLRPALATLILLRVRVKCRLVMLASALRRLTTQDSECRLQNGHGRLRQAPSQLHTVYSDSHYRPRGHSPARHHAGSTLPK